MSPPAIGKSGNIVSCDAAVVLLVAVGPGGNPGLVEIGGSGAGVSECGD